MSSGGSFILLSNDASIDKYLLNTLQLNQRIKNITLKKNKWKRCFNIKEAGFN